MEEILLSMKQYETNAPKFLEVIKWVKDRKDYISIINLHEKFNNSSFYLGIKYKEQGTTFHKATELSTKEYQAEGGAFPLILRGHGRIGTVTVSGLTGEEIMH